MIPRNRKDIQTSEIQKLVGPIPTIVEVGCHDGSDTVRFLTLMPKARVFCFDCEQRALIRFKKRLGKDPRVTLYEKAVADVDGEKLFYASTGHAGKYGDWDYSGSLCKPTGHLTRSPEIKFRDPVLIPCTRLDTWLGETDLYRIHFLWADVQGSQRLLIAGGHAALSLTDYLYIESHDPVAYAGEPTQEELIDDLSKLFQPLAFYGENILFRNNRISR